jgi:putative peptidoglycan lipid II flippase
MTDSVMRNSAYMAAGTLVSRITGVLRDVAMTAALGFYLISDAYSLGNTLPNIIYILVAGGALNAVFIPQLVRHMKDDSDSGKAFADRLLTATGTLLLALSVLTVVVAPWIVQLYSPADMSQEQFDLAVAFARLCLPQIFFYGAYTMLQQVLNARGKFAAAMFAPVANNLVAIAVFLTFIFIMQPTPENLSSLSSEQVWWLGAGTTLGVVLQAMVLFPPLIASGFKLKLRFDWRGSGLGKAAKLAGWTVGLVLANQIAYIAITRIATAANLAADSAGAVPTGLTTYQKAHLVFVLPHSLIAVSLVTALLPMMSRLAHDGNLVELGNQISRNARILLTGMIPISVLLYVTASDIAVLLFGYGAAGVDAARATGTVISMMAIGLPAYSLVYVLYRAWYAQENTKTPFLIAVVLNVLNLMIAIPLSNTVENDFKVASLGVAYSISYLLTAAVAWIWLRRTGIPLETVRTLTTATKLLGAGLLSGFALWALPDFAPDTQLQVLLQVTVNWLLGMSIFVLAAILFKISEIKSLLELINRKFRRP